MYFAGLYIFIEASKKNPGDKARLFSDETEPNENVCVQFWYHMHGSEIGKLSIYLKTKQSEELVWRLSGDQGNRWRFGQTALNSPSFYKVSSHGWLPINIKRYVHFGIKSNVNIFLSSMLSYLVKSSNLR